MTSYLFKNLMMAYAARSLSNSEFSLKLYYKFDATLLDYSGNSHSITNYTSDLEISDKYILTANSAGYAEVPIKLGNTNNTTTFVAFYYEGKQSYRSYLYGRCGNTGSSWLNYTFGIRLSKTTDTAHQCTVLADGTTMDIASGLIENKINTIAVVRTSTKLSVYINGELYNTVTGTTNNYSSSDLYPLFIASCNMMGNSGNEGASAKIHEFRYYLTELSLTEIQKLHNSCSSQIIVNMNDQWLTSSVSNPDPSLYNIYESYSNYNVDNGTATMTITITGYNEFTCYIRSNAEFNYDYVMIGQLDQAITGSTSYSNTTLVKAYTRGNQQSGTALSNYTEVKYTNIDGGTHTITVVYRKDSSVNSGADKGYILIPK